MGDDQKSCPKRVCLKIFKAITFSPAIQTIRRLSHQPQTSLSSDSHPRTSTTRIRSKPNSQSLGKEGSEVVQVEFDYSPANTQTHVVHSEIAPSYKIRPKVKAKAKADRVDTSKANTPKGSVVWKNNDLRAKKPHEAQNETNLTEAGRKKSAILHTEDHFTDYINRAKLKIRATSNVGDVKNSESELESNTSGGGGKDHFSEYIKRAKMKIRATSSMRNYSFK